MTACIQVDLKHIIQDEAGVGDLDTLEIGIELKDFYPSVECDFWQSSGTYSIRDAVLTCARKPT